MLETDRVQSEREWSYSVGPRGYRIRVFQRSGYSGGNLCIEIRDTRFPGEYRYRCLSLHHQEREKAIRYARVMARWWKLTGTPPKIALRRGRGPLSIGLDV